MACFICGREELFRFLDLGHQPPSDAFLRTEELAKPEAKYPLELYFCTTCTLVQLGYVVPPEVLFTEYVYTTGMNNSLRENFRNLVAAIIRRFSLTVNDLAVDIGSNDGTLLANYAAHGVKTLGVDPSSAAALAEQKGITTVRDFFSREVAERIQKEYGRTKIITATNVFAHVPDPPSFMEGLQTLLTKDGVFVSESGYLLDMLETLGYDTVYHEHLRYYSLKPLLLLFQNFGLEVFDVEWIPSHSGSIRVYAGYKGAHRVERSAADLLAGEEKAGLYKKETFMKFGKRVKEHREGLVTLLRQLKQSSTRIVGIGAPAKGNTLLNFCGITPDVVDCLLEKSDLKIGLFAPGTHIPVRDEKVLFTEQPEYALLLSWNLADELIPKLKNKGYRGKFIIPFPQVTVV